MALKKNAVKGIVWSFAESWGRQAVSSLIFLLLARLLSPETFGLVALADLFVTFMRLFVDQGFAQAIIQKTDLQREHLDSAFWISVLMAVILTLASVPIASFAASFYGEAQLKLIIIVTAFGFIFNALSSVQEAILNRKLAFKSLAVRSFIAILVSGSVGVSLAYYSFGVWSIVGQQLTYGAVSTVTLWFASSWRPTFKISVSHAKELFIFGINVLGFKFVNFFGLKTDDMLIGYFLGPTQLGYYVVAYKILLIMRQLLISVVSKVALPVFSKLQNEPDKLRSAFYNVTQLSSFFAFPIFIGVSVMSPILIATFLGDEWLPSVPVMQILLFLGPLHAISYYNSSVILAKGKPDWRLYIQTFSVVVNIIGFLIAVKFGIVAIAFSCVLRGYLVSPIPVIAINRLITIDYGKYLKQYVSPIIASTIMAVIMYSCSQYLEDVTNSYLLLGISAAAGMFTYIATIAVISPDILKQLKSLAKYAYAK